MKTNENAAMMPKPRTIHDFGGFPKALFDVQYPAPGSPELAKETIQTVKSTTIIPDETWGLDHGTWSVMLERNHKSITQYKNLGTAVQLAVPTPDHFLPLIYALALQEDAEQLSFFQRQRKIYPDFYPKTTIPRLSI